MFDDPYELVAPDGARLTVRSVDSKALILGGSWLAIGIIYLLVLTRGFTRQPPDLAGIAEAE